MIPNPPKSPFRKGGLDFKDFSSTFPPFLKGGQGGFVSSNLLFGPDFIDFHLQDGCET
jgi:hypothetical protein